MTDAPKVSRRGLLGAAGAGAAGVALGAGAWAALQPKGTHPTGPVVVRHSYSPHGEHQPGITTPMTAVTEIVAFTLRAETDKAALARLMRMWSGDIAALMAGRPIPGDMTPELAQANVGLTIAVGLGPKVFTLAGLERQAPPGFVEIPAMVHDKLQDKWNGGDLVVVVSADDPTSVDYAVEAMVRDADTFATPRWVQRGEWRPTDGDGNRVTGRNLFGQVDGTANPKEQALDDALWPVDVAPWFAGGTQLVVRRIEMDLHEWNRLTRNEQERAMGRDLAQGAPLTGGDEHAAPDFAALDDSGQPVIPANSHVRLSHPSNLGGIQILRRATNYSHSEVVDGTLKRTHGLVFVAYCANIAKQFVPMQKMLDEFDALNQWTTAIGSAVFAMLPGFPSDSWLGRQLFEG